MADFVQKSVTKTAVRVLTAPIANAAAIKTIADSVVSTNPFECTSYEVSGVTMNPVIISKQSYSPPAPPSSSSAISITCVAAIRKTVSVSPHWLVSHQRPAPGGRGQAHNILQLFL
ncbi:MAG TPA: hypothetical protein PLN56_11050 [Methanoregulaceae archaeon]|nr:MAG: hypothetical protein IPI71_09545 [Methanolinea sp.]HON82473.1 hypothetical protein [Methanoregulaceae archaeon]HPD11517.1 hypothetical protein [Methanoregulaceae archaeon]